MAQLQDSRLRFAPNFALKVDLDLNGAWLPAGRGELEAAVLLRFLDLDIVHDLLGLQTEAHFRYQLARVDRLVSKVYEHGPLVVVLGRGASAFAPDDLMPVAIGQLEIRPFALRFLAAAAAVQLGLSFSESYRVLPLDPVL